MKMEQATRQRITKNVILSLFIYILPIAAMFITFTITGQRPWLKKQPVKTQQTKSVNTKNNDGNGSND
ncbi:hypothetical protein [Mucilaginibacter sp. FT3.2]|uniref:hypothetical protein n=1 Tax=Mucilaginibacter sp. FT3.2 TaxID=2723090 RepID=UPI0016140F01|nr:hypothetical protein [Mucilaginibacter sp. FT3.2]MBB6231414.1 hypothetical protein [Mucilaginibacter sp. FT3.2]